MEQDFSGDFINEFNTKDNDILTIISDVLTEVKQSPTQKVLDRKTNAIVPKNYTEYKVDVEANGLTKTYKINSSTGIRMQMSWGKDSSKWIGKQFSVKHKPYQAYGVAKVSIDGYPLIEQKVAA